MSVRSVSVKVVANIREYTAGMRDMARETKKFSDEVSKTAAQGKGDLDAVANGAIAAGLALGGALAVGISKAAAFDHAMAQVNAVANSTAAEFEDMRQTAIDMGAATVFSATEAANATEELAKAGLSAAEITGGALAGALNLAAAGGVGLAEAATIAANTMNQFKLEASEMSSVADTLAGSANASSTDVTGLGESLKNVGTVAAQAGLTVEETVGFLSAFGDQALVGAEAGTALRTVLLRLMAPTGAAKEEMDRLGIAIFDANGEALSAVEIVRNLENGFRGLTMEQRTAAMNTIFGAEAIAGANIILAEGASSIENYIEKVSEQGVAAETAAKRMDSLQGDVNKLTSALEGLAIESSGGVTQGLRVMAQAATDFVDEINDLPNGVTSTAVVLGTLAAAGLIAFGAVTKLRGSLATMNAQLAATGPAGTRAAGALSKVGSVAGGVIGVLGALKAASMVLSAALHEDLNPQVDALAVGIERWARDGKLAGEAARVFGDDIKDLGEALLLAGDAQARMMTANSGNALVDWFSGGEEKLEAAEEKVKALDSAIAQLHAGGNVEGAQMAFDQLADAAMAQGMSMEEVKAIFPEYQAALEVAAEKTNEAAEAVSPYTSELEILAANFGLVGESAEEAVTEMLEVWQEASAAFIDLLGAYNDGLAELDEGQKLTTESFIENLRAQAEAQEEWANNLQELAARGVGGMINELAAMGPEGAEMVALMADMTDAELQEVVELWGRRGAQTGDELAEGILEGTSQSIDGIDNLQRWIQGLESKTITITTRHVNQYAQYEFGMGASQLNRWGGVYEHAEQGLISANVYSTRNPARYAFAEPATGGEAFIPKRGNPDRSMAILAEAASWYGASVVPDTGGTQWRSARPIPVTSSRAAGDRGGDAEARVTIDLANADSEFGRWFRKMVRVEGGGSVQRAFGRS